MDLQQFILFCTDFDFIGSISFSLVDGTSSVTSNTNNNINSTSNSNSNSNNDNHGGKDDITLKDMRQVFSASQHDTAMNEAENQLEDDNHQETMVFPEYIEAIVRLGFLKYSSSRENNDKHHFECVRLAITKVSSTNVK